MTKSKTTDLSNMHGVIYKPTHINCLQVYKFRYIDTAIVSEDTYSLFQFVTSGPRSQTSLTPPTPAVCKVTYLTRTSDVYYHARILGFVKITCTWSIN